MSRPTCATCRFWSPPNAVGDAHCRRSAPVIFQKREHPDTGARWPIVESDDWCGEHVARLSPREVSVAFSQETDVRFDGGGKDKPT